MTDSASMVGGEDLELCQSVPAEIDIAVTAGAWSQHDLDLTLGAVEATLTSCSANKAGVSVAVNLADDATLHSLNQSYRGRDKATNVLSFPALDPTDVASALERLTPTDPPLHLGDLAVADGVLAQEAATQVKDRADHLRHLIVHGTLHLLGHDHMEDMDASAMEQLEIQILATLGTYDPYRERARGEAAPGL